MLHDDLIKTCMYNICINISPEKHIAQQLHKHFSKTKIRN